MDTSNWPRPNQPPPPPPSSVESSVRTLVSPETRHKIVIKIMDDLKKHVQFSGQEKLHELKDIALRIEDKIYTAATNYDDYMRKISSKLLSLQNRFANHMSNSACTTLNPSDPGQLNNQGETQPPSIPVPSSYPQAGKQVLPQSIHNNVSSSGVPPGNGIAHLTGQNSSLQNIQNISVGNNMGHGIPPSNFVSQRHLSGSQRSPHYLYQQQPHQIAKPKLQQNNININNNNNNLTSVQPHIQQQQQSYAFMQPTTLQPSSLSTIKQTQQPHYPQSGQPVSQHYQQMVLRQQRQQQPRMFGQQNSLSSVQSIGQHNNFSGIHQQQHLGPQNSPKQPQSLGTQSGNSMLNNQHSSHLMQSTQSQRAQMELQQQLQTQSAQFQHQVNMKQRLPTSFNQQRAMPEASSTSSDSTAQTGHPNSGDWQEEVYQKVKAMKDKYFQELADMYRICRARLQQHDSFSQPPNGDQVERLKKYKHTLECCMKFLKLLKNNITLNHKETLGVYEKEIVNLITSQRRKLAPTLQQQRMNQMQQSQQTQIQPHESQMNLQHNNLVTLHHNLVSNPQQYMMSMLPHQQLKQLQSRQMQQQLLQKQQLLHQQTKHNTKLNVNQPQHQINDANELKIKQEIKSESLKQLSSVTKSSTPLQPASSALVVSSPSTPSTSNVQGDPDKIVSLGASLLSNEGIICTPGMSTSNPDVNHATDASVVSGKSTTVEQPLERLLKVIKSISSKSLSASVKDIDMVVSMGDSVVEPTSDGESINAVSQDLVAMAYTTTTGKRKTKHLMNPMFINVVSSPCCVNDSFNQLKYLENSELESTATSTIKRPRVEMKHPLLDEIRKINQGLIDTVVDISQENADSDGKGTIVKCSYSAVALGPNLKSQYASVQMPPIQPLRLLVPANYPNCSPILLDKVPVEVNKEYEDLSIKVKWRFNSCVRRLCDPMSLEKMARTWDDCARAVILECVQQSGGGTFTSKYGAWEDCLTAA
ncbi:mediator of RNA polymerase II transcription subunit 15a-like [Bidens hawaiensis]|uniref:mediator of RNA polymerase II transcription subunit 15a-like n=1 Tax=Bidens hawaiensis TaxID=980011 RepID=UPI00404A1A66